MTRSSFPSSSRVRLTGCQGELRTSTSVADIAPVVELLDPRATFAPPNSPLAEVRPGVAVCDPQSDAWAEALSGRECEQPAIESADVALAMMTSGSTGTPKIVLHTHRSLAYKALSWDPEQAVRLVDSEGVRFIGGASTFLSGMVESTGFASQRVRSLRLVAMGGSSMSTETIASLAETLGCSVKRTYGATEAPSVTTAHAGDPRSRDGGRTGARPSPIP